MFIEIDNDKDDCIDGWMSMDIEVTIDGEDFDFNPSCNFSFSEKNQTQTGKSCKIEAGMCSGFSPEEEFQIECDDGRVAEIDILCPPEK